MRASTLRMSRRANGCRTGVPALHCGSASQLKTRDPWPRYRWQTFLQSLQFHPGAVHIRRSMPAPSRFSISYELQASLFHAYELSKALPQQLFQTWQARVRTLTETEREIAVLQRIGQDFFREGLLTLWNGQCAVSGLAFPALLRASHAKPWSCSSDEERLDVYNGVLLAAHFDAAFDHGLIAFTSDGLLLVSDHLSSSDRALIGLDRTWPAIALRSQHLPYLEFHRENVFVDALSPPYHAHYSHLTNSWVT